MNRSEATDLLGQLATWIEAIKSEANDAGSLLILSGPSHHSHPLSELHPTTIGFLTFLHDNAIELRELQRAYLPRAFWEQNGNLDLDESDPSPLVRLLLAHREQPIVSCALGMVSRGRGINEERSFLFGSLSVMAVVMECHLRDAPTHQVPPSSERMRQITQLRRDLPSTALWILDQLRSGTACIGQLRIRKGAPSIGTLKRRIPRLKRLGLVRDTRDGATKDWQLTDMGRAVASDSVA